jgi:hypothetical protein
VKWRRCVDRTASTARRALRAGNGVLRVRRSGRRGGGGGRADETGATNALDVEFWQLFRKARLLENRERQTNAQVVRPRNVERDVEMILDGDGAATGGLCLWQRGRNGELERGFVRGAGRGGSDLVVALKENALADIDLLVALGEQRELLLERELQIGELLLRRIANVDVEAQHVARQQNRAVQHNSEIDLTAANDRATCVSLHTTIHIQGTRVQNALDRDLLGRRAQLGDGAKLGFYHVENASVRVLFVQRKAARRIVRQREPRLERVHADGQAVVVFGRTENQNLLLK